MLAVFALCFIWVEGSRGEGPPRPPLAASLLVAASLQREVTLGDLETAFMQSDKKVAERPEGKLYASLPPGGIPLEDGLPKDRLSSSMPQFMVWSAPHRHGERHS